MFVKNGRNKTAMDQQFIPKKNEKVTVEIIDLGEDGCGIGKYRSFTLFIKDALPGDVAEVLILKVKKSYGYAKVIRILQPSPYRVEPRCKLASKCGGCQLQHLSYEKQLEYKLSKVTNCLERIGGVKQPPIEGIIGMEEPFDYRNKAQFPVGRGKDGKICIGFYAGRTHAIINTERCHIQAEINADLIRVIRSFLEEESISIYDKTSGQGLVRHIVTRVGFRTGEIMVCLVINGEALPEKERLVQALKELEKMNPKYRVKSICLNINKKSTNVILGKKILPIYGEPYITDWIGDVKFQISPLSFYQVNPVQTEKLYAKALEFAELQGDEVVWDLYCGIGTISLFLARHAKQVYGVEIVPEAIEDAKKNAALNGILNAEFFVGASEEVLPEKYKESKGEMRADVVVVDPPRKGCDEAVLRTIAEMGVEKVVYVSCDPGTLGRDVKIMMELGYEMKKGVAVDMFGETGHVEVCVLMSRVEK